MIVGSPSAAKFAEERRRTLTFDTADDQGHKKGPTKVEARGLGSTCATIEKISNKRESNLF